MKDTVKDTIPQMNMRSSLNQFSKLNHPPINFSGAGLVIAGLKSVYLKLPISISAQ